MRSIEIKRLHESFSVGESFQVFCARVMGVGPVGQYIPLRDIEVLQKHWRKTPAWYDKTRRPLFFDAKTGDWTAPEFLEDLAERAAVFRKKWTETSEHLEVLRRE